MARRAVSLIGGRTTAMGLARLAVARTLGRKSPRVCLKCTTAVALVAGSDPTRDDVGMSRIRRILLVLSVALATVIGFPSPAHAVCFSDPVAFLQGRNAMYCVGVGGG